MRVIVKCYSGDAFILCVYSGRTVYKKKHPKNPLCLWWAPLRVCHGFLNELSPLYLHHSGAPYNHMPASTEMNWIPPVFTTLPCTCFWYKSFADVIYPAGIIWLLRFSLQRSSSLLINEN